MQRLEGQRPSFAALRSGRLRDGLALGAAALTAAVSSTYWSHFSLSQLLVFRWFLLFNFGYKSIKR